MGQDVILQSLGVIRIHSAHDNALDRRGQRARMNRKGDDRFADRGFRRHEAACAPRDSTLQLTASRFRWPVPSASIHATAKATKSRVGSETQFRLKSASPCSTSAHFGFAPDPFVFSLRATAAPQLNQRQSVDPAFRRHSGALRDRVGCCPDREGPPWVRTLCR